MIVVSDTSPVTSLIQVGHVDLLARIYGEVFIPIAVRDELQKFHVALPDFVRTLPVSSRADCLRLMQFVDPGEAEAIVLAKELKADELLMDDSAGRRVAESEGLKPVGLLGVILEAKERGLLPSVRDFMDELEAKAGFFVSEPVRNLILRAAGEL